MNTPDTTVADVQKELARVKRERNALLKAFTEILTHPAFHYPNEIHCKFQEDADLSGMMNATAERLIRKALKKG